MSRELKCFHFSSYKKFKEIWFETLIWNFKVDLLVWNSQADGAFAGKHVRFGAAGNGNLSLRKVWALLATESMNVF
jgi:hypothetical protein